MNALSIVFLGNPALRRVSKAVANVKAPAVRQLLASMEAQVRKEEGVGLAAPQLGQNQRMFLMLKDAPLVEDELDGRIRLEYQECINPEILKASSRKVKDFEGCLSIPGYVGVVTRPQEIQVAFSDVQGKRHTQTLADFPARIFQHELDHLDGVLYLDRLEKDTLIHEQEFQQLDRNEIAKILGN